MLYICIRFPKIFQRVSEGRNFHILIFKGANSLKNASGVTILCLCISSDYALSFVLMIVNISQRVSEVFSEHDFPTKMFKGT